MSKYEIIETKEIECKQAVIFARVSSQKQENGVSKEAQISAMTSYCNKNGLKIVKSHSIMESSTIGDRPKFKEMIEFLKKQKQKTALVVQSVDRLQRGFDETSIINKLARDGIIEVHFLKENFNIDQDAEQAEEMQYDLNVFSAKMYISALRNHVLKSQKFITITSEIKDVVERIIEIAGNLSNIMKTADYKIQNQLLKLLLKDCTLKDGKLTYNVREPFSAFISTDVKKTIPDYITNNIQEFNKIAYPVGLLSNYLPSEKAAI